MMKKDYMQTLCKLNNASYQIIAVSHYYNDAVHKIKSPSLRFRDNLDR